MRLYPRPTVKNVVLPTADDTVFRRVRLALRQRFVRGKNATLTNICNVARFIIISHITLCITGPTRSLLRAINGIFGMMYVICTVPRHRNIPKRKCARENTYYLQHSQQ